MQAVGYAISCKLVAKIISHHISAATRPGTPPLGACLYAQIKRRPKSRKLSADSSSSPLEQPT